MLKLTVSEDIQTCPQCDDGTPLVQIGYHLRQCNSCGVAIEWVTEENELDAEADRQVLTREYNEGHGRGKAIAKYQQRW